jgi:hypothetical protein
MKLPKIKRATWEKDYHPGAKWIVVERKYNTYYPCASLLEAIKGWLYLIGVPYKTHFGTIRRTK